MEIVRAEFEEKSVCGLNPYYNGRYSWRFIKD